MREKKGWFLAALLHLSTALLIPEDKK